MAKRRKRVKEPEQEAQVVEAPQGEDVVVSVDPVGEQALIAAACADRQVRERLVRKYPPDNFLVADHKVIWWGLRELENRKLDFDVAVLQQVVGDKLNVEYLNLLLELRPDVPGDENLKFFEEAFEWDRQRANATTGPIASLLEAVKNPREAPERVRSLARHVADAFEGNVGRGRYLLDPKEVVRQSVAELDRRISATDRGEVLYPYGIDGLDYYEDGSRRMIMGSAPGLVTLLTAVTGGGKSTFVGHMTLGIARQRRKILYAAWESKAPMTIELLACISLGWSRTDVRLGANFNPERRVLFEETQHEISKWVRFMSNPFRRSTRMKTNDAALDVVQEHIVDSGASVFIADLWARCLKEKKPEAEEDALWRQQAMAEELNVHCVILHQQRIKDIEMRQDKRPTREGMKGSSAYAEIADVILAPHRPALFKRIEDKRLEVFVLKQRDGAAPLGVEFNWNADTGGISEGHSIEYNPPGEQGGEDDSRFIAAKPRKKAKRGSQDD